MGERIPLSLYRRATDWALWLLHAPLAGLLAALWLIAAVLLGAGLVDLVRAPRHGLELLGLAGLMVTLINAVARVKGVAALPRRAANDALLGDAGALEPLAKADAPKREVL